MFTGVAFAEELQSESGVVCPPWETAPYGVVSLLAMLEFSVSDYVELTYQIGLFLGAGGGKKVSSETLTQQFGKFLKEINRLNLRVTQAHINQLAIEYIEANPGKLRITPAGVPEIVDGTFDMSRFFHHFEAIYTTLRAELGAILFRAIPQEKNKYCDPKWLLDTPMFSKFPDTIDEFQRAGRCFAFGENTACVFHLMRVTDFYLRKVAESLNAQYDARTWQGIGDIINKKMEQKYLTKTDDWKQKEPFYAEILTDLQAISRGHRNPALHELEKKYDEREAIYMLTVIESFARHVAGNL